MGDLGTLPLGGLMPLPTADDGNTKGGGPEEDVDEESGGGRLGELQCTDLSHPTKCIFHLSYG